MLSSCNLNWRSPLPTGPKEVTSDDVDNSLQRLSTPSFNILEGEYLAPEILQVSSDDEGVTLHCTTNGRTPTCYSPLCSAPFIVDNPTAWTTYKAIACKRDSDLLPSEVISGQYLFYGRIPQPTYSITPGSYVGFRTVSIIPPAGHSNAVIHYTLNGNNPSCSDSNIYTPGSTINLNSLGWKRFKAIACRPEDEWKNSNVAPGEFLIQENVNDPVINPDSGTYVGGTTVSISTNDGAEIHYTINSSDVSCSSQEYSSSVNLNADGTYVVRAIACRTPEEYVPSNIVTKTYIVQMISGNVASPTFNLSSGESQTVTMSSSTSGSTIFYTTDGSDPECNVGSQYTVPISISSTSSYKAIACKSLMYPSSVASVTYQKIPAVSYGLDIGTDPQHLSMSTATSGDSIYYTSDGSTPTCSAGGSTSLYVTAVTVNAPREYKTKACKTGMVNSDVYSYILTQEEQPTITLSDAASQTVTMNPSTSGFNLYYTTDLSSPKCNGSNGSLYVSGSPIAINTATTYKVIACHPGQPQFGGVLNSLIKTTTFDQVIPAGFNLSSGSLQYMTMSTETSGASIYYTIDGSIPTCWGGGTSTLYPGSPVLTNSTTTFRTIACKTGMVNSGISAALVEKLSTPAFNPATDIQDSSISFTITSSAGSTIHYSYTGTADCSTSPSGSSPVSANTPSTPGVYTYSAIACRTSPHNYINSNLATATYTVRPVQPVFSPDPWNLSDPAGLGYYYESQNVSITSSTLGATIRYTTNGDTPTCSSGTAITNGQSVLVDRITTLKAVACYNSAASLVTTGQYEFKLPLASITFPDGNPLQPTEYESSHQNEIGLSWGPGWYVRSIVHTPDDANHYRISSNPSRLEHDTGQLISGVIGATQYGITSTQTYYTTGTPGRYFIKVIVQKLELPSVVHLWHESDVYTSDPLDVLPLAPTVTPDTGTYTDPVTVTIAKTETGGDSGRYSIIYTTNGANPICGGTGTTYTVPFDISSTSTLKTRVCFYINNSHATYGLAYLASPIVSKTYTITGTLAAPQMNPAGGTYSSAQNVSISADSGATIHYTTNGDTPTCSSTTYSSAINVASPGMTIKAIACKTGWSNSAVTTETYIIDETVYAIDITGTNYATNTIQTGSFAGTCTPGITGLSTTLGTLTDSDCSDGTFTVSYNSLLEWPNPNIFTVSGTTPFSTTVNDSITYYYSNASPLIEITTNGGNNFSTNISSTIDLSGTCYNPTEPDPESSLAWKAMWNMLVFRSPGSNPNGLCNNGSWSLSGFTLNTGINHIVVRGANGFTHADDTIDVTYDPSTLLAPDFNYSSGTYYDPINVEISSLDTNVVIRYTMDGSDPNCSTSDIYSSPLSLSVPDTLSTIKAISCRAYWTPSAISSGTYLITGTLNAPQMNPVGDSYSSAQNVSISADSGATIHYTTNGDIPTCSSTTYSSAINVASPGMTIKAIACKQNWNDSPVKTEVYVIDTTVYSLDVPTSASTNTATGSFVGTCTPGITGLTTTLGTLDVANCNSGSFTVNYTNLLEWPQYNTFTVSGTDPLGATVSDTYTLYYGPESPNVIITTNSGFDFSTNVQAQSLSGTCSTPYTGTALTIMPISGVSGDYDCTDGTWSLSGFSLNSGVNNIVITVLDIFNHSVTDEINITYDIAPPSVAITSPNSGNDFSTNIASQTISGTCSTDTVSIATNLGSFTDNNCSNGDWSLDVGSLLSVGANVITVTAHDAAGNTASDAITVTYSNHTLVIPGFNYATGTYYSEIDVTITSLDGAEIRYTLDGSQPNCSTSDIYSSYIALSVPDTITTIKAIACRPFWTSSSIGAETYLITGKVSTPVISLAGNTYTSSQTVTISESTPGATVRYTLDGSTPACDPAAGTLYAGAITINNPGATLKAIGCKANWQDSDLASETYVITGTVDTPVFSLASNTYTSPQTISITVANPSGSDIYYTVNGADPTCGSGILYTGSISLNTSGVYAYKAIACKSGWISSSIATANYTYRCTSLGLTSYSFNSSPAINYGISSPSTFPTVDVTGSLKLAVDGHQVAFSVVTECPDSKITINSQAVSSGDFSTPIPIDIGPAAGTPNRGPLYIVVTSWDDSASRTYTIDPIYRGITVQEAYIKKNASTTAFDQFGRSLAMDGNTLVVGVENDHLGVGDGRVYVYVRDGSDPNNVGSWSLQQILAPSDGQNKDGFGHSVAIDGDVIAVGANGYPAGANRGAVYIFTRSGTTWTQENIVTASNGEAGDRFAESLALAGNRLIVGAPLEDSNLTGIFTGSFSNNNSSSNAGAVYIFEGLGSWTQMAYVKAVNTDAGDEFGSSVAISSNGLDFAVGSYKEASCALGVGGDADNDSCGEAGAAYVFVSRSGEWSQQAYIKASNAEEGDWFGYSVAIDAGYLVVGAPHESSNATGFGGNQTNNMASHSGAVYVFERDSETWSQESYIKASNSAADYLFGWSLYGKAAYTSVLIVGAPGEKGDKTGINPSGTPSTPLIDAGAAYIIIKQLGQPRFEHAYIKASNTDAGDGFGVSVATNGDIFVIGAPGESSSATGIGGIQSDDSYTYAGAVYTFY